ncbi:MAG: aminotransferase class V-fold PLP-dependent enzyme [Nitrospira sp.]|nr:aminotransferase class V-fold PLP-dependent enzyme [Nitrospira sp.]
MLYLNYAALCPTPQDIWDEVEQTLATFGHHLYSETGVAWYRHTVQACRRKVGTLLHVEDPSTIAFTANASTAHQGALAALHWNPGDTLLTTTHENPSITRQLHALEHDGVHRHAIHPTSPDAFLHEVQAHMSRARVKAIVMSHVSHVDGRIFPIHDVAALARAGQCLVIIDGAQAVGHIPVDLGALDCDAYFFTGHKWCEGPLGTGAIVTRDTFFRHPACRAFPGGPPGAPPASRFEIGTHNIGLIAGLARACERRHQQGLTTHHQTALRETARSTLGAIPHCRIVEWHGPQAPGILTVTGRPDRDYRQLVKRLESEYGMIVKGLVDYPETIAPAIRMSWSSGIPRQDVQTGLSTLAHLLAS